MKSFRCSNGIMIKYDTGGTSSKQFFEEIKRLRETYASGEQNLSIRHHGMEVGFSNYTDECPRDEFLKAFDEFLKDIQPKRQIFTLEVELVGANVVSFSDIEKDLIRPNVNYDRDWDCRYDIEKVKVLSCQDIKGVRE